MKHAVLPLFLLMPLWALAQMTITTRVVDAESGEPLPLVGVYVSEENNTLTNFDGEFTLTAEPDDRVRFTYVGHETLTLRAADIPRTLKMNILDATLQEVTVKAVEGTLLQVGRKMEKRYKRKDGKTAQYFYRQTSVFGLKQDIVEAFVEAHSAVNLRQLGFLTGRHGALSRKQWQNSTVNEMNLHHLLELGPMVKEASFWKRLITPLEPSGGIDYLQRHYDITMEGLSDGNRQLYRFNLSRREEDNPQNTEPLPMMTGTLYIDSATLEPLTFEGEIDHMKIVIGKGSLRSPTVFPVTLEFRIDYRNDHNYPEVANLSMQAKWGNFMTRTMLFNVESQKRMRVNKNKKKVRENMLSTIAETGYNKIFWENNEVIKRTAEEEAIAQGSVDLVQARIDSVANYQASLPPLARLSDRLERFGQAIPQEKVFVHMDNTGYFLGDTIWFAAYLRKTNTDTPSPMSRVLYAELWNHDGYLVERKLIEMKGGRGHGFFALPDTLYSGYFELRAYTRWQLNWGQTEHFHAWYTEYYFYNKAMAKDYFRDYEKLYSRVFPVYDKPKQPGDFYKDMTLRPMRRYFKSAPKPSELRLSLFPEGGNLVAGVPCRVAFEAATSEGEVREGTLSLRVKSEKKKHEKAKSEKSKKNKGKEPQEKHREILSVRTENRGRGTFTFTPEEGTKYEAVFTPDEQPADAKRPMTVSQDIKDVKAEGVSLQVHRERPTPDPSRKGGESWRFDIAAVGKAAEQPLGVTVMHEGRTMLFQEITGSPSTRIHYTPLLEREGQGGESGIHQVTVFDSIGHIYADRLFFVTRPELTQPTLQYTGLKEQYAPFEPIDIDITSAHLMPDQTISLAVRDAVHTDNTFDSSNILTEMLLSSEIKGFVPQPDYFFEKDDEEHRRALDLLMLTQGWRRFNWQDMAVKGMWELTHPAEHTQIVTGTVNRYWVNENLYDQVLADHERFMTEWTPSLSEQQNIPLVDADGRPTQFKPFSGGSFMNSYGNRNMGWNMEPLYERRQNIGAISDTWHGIFSDQGHSWNNTDYNNLSFKTSKWYRQEQKKQLKLAARRYLETGNVKKEVRVHAEFVDPFNLKNNLIGETETTQGRFQIDLPRFEGSCLFYLGASDTTQWKKKWDGLRRRKPHTWVQLDNYDEYDAMAERLPDYPEYYVRLNYPYPRWVKPYTYYQVHNAPLRDTTYLSPRLLTDGTHLLDQVTVRARHGGLRRIDFSKPAYVIDAYEALNLAMDAGLADPSISSYYAASRVCQTLISDMGMYRHWDYSTYQDKWGAGYWWGPLEQKRWGLLTYIDKFYIYTDYSPRREGDERYDQDNQPMVCVNFQRFPDQTQRVIYRDRRYILDGFAYQEDFYHPDYKRNPPAEGQKDYRRTLYWNPDLQLDASGHARISFFNNSQQTQICVEANGQATDGSLLYGGSRP